MRFVLLNEGGELEYRELEFLPVEPMTPDEQKQLLECWTPWPGEWVQ